MHQKWYFLRISIFLFVIGLFLVPFGSARKQIVPGQNYQGQQGAAEGTVQYQFQNNILVNFQSNFNLTLNFDIDPALQNKTATIALNASDTTSTGTFSLKMNNSFYITPNKKIGKYQDLGAGKVTQENIGGNNRPTVYPTTSTDSETLSDISFTYNSIYAISYSANLSSFILSIPLDSIEGFSPQENLSWCIFDSSSESWYLLESDQTDTSLSVDLTSVSLNYETSILTVVSILQPTTPFWETSWGITILILGAIAIVFGLLMSKAEYRSYLLNRAMPLETGPHRLSMEEILENENRLKIIDIIIDHPGIHFNALLREIGISAGNLAWHLDLLETFKVVRKERMGQYLMYYPYLEKNPISRLDPKLQKSKTTLEILRLIDDNPGIYQNQIAKRLDIDHKTVKYHIDKLIENEIIYMKKEKGNKGFYPHEWPVVDADFDTHE